MKTIRIILAPWWAVVLLLLALFAHAPQAQAAATPPDLMTYQGFLVDGAGQALGLSAPKNYDVIFRIYKDQNSDVKLWAEQQTVTVDKGYFSVLLGEGTPVGSEPNPALSSLFQGTDDVSERFVEITVKGIGAGSPPADVVIKPRLRLLTSPYAFLARHAVSLVSGTNQVVTTQMGFVGINTASPSAQLDVNGTVKATSFSGNGVIPVGGIIMWSGTTPPAGWALCDGTQGTPDLRGRFVLGAGPGLGLTARAVGNAGGEERHQLSEAEMPSHTHGISPAQVRNDEYGFGSSEPHFAVGSSYPGTVWNITWTGGSLAHENMPPFYVLAFIMRVQ